MASVHVVLCTVQGHALTGATLPVASSMPIGTDHVDLGAESVLAELVAEAAGLVWVITAIGGAAWLAFGAEPQAQAGTGWRLAEGPPLYLAATAPGERLAAIAAV